MVALLNDRWRTREIATTDDSGAVELRATHGDYVAEWTSDGDLVHARFHVGRGPEPLTVVAVESR